MALQESPTIGPRWSLTMTPSEIQRGVAMRRYAFGKPIRQIADEAGLPYERVLAVIKGEPMNIATATRLEGYLKTPARPSELYRDRHPDGIMSETRRRLFKHLVRTRVIGRHYGVFYKRDDNLAAFTDDDLRCYVFNAQDRLREEIIAHHPKLCGYFKLPDGLQPC